MLEYKKRLRRDNKPVTRRPHKRKGKLDTNDTVNKEEEGNNVMKLNHNKTYNSLKKKYE